MQRKGSKVVFDVTGKDPAQPLPGLVRAALLNPAGASGLEASDIEIVVVSLGAATTAAYTLSRQNQPADLMMKFKAA